MNDEDGNPMFAFQDIDYIPFGFSSHLAPYIETGPGTMRAAATLMRLGQAGATNPKPSPEEVKNTVICDLGCGDGEFRMHKLQCQLGARVRACVPSFDSLDSFRWEVELMGYSLIVSLFFKSSVCWVISMLSPQTAQ